MPEPDREMDPCFNILTLLMLFELFILKGIDNFQNNYEYLGRCEVPALGQVRRSTGCAVWRPDQNAPRQDLDLLANDGGGPLDARKRVCCYPLLLRWPILPLDCCPSCCVLRVCVLTFIH